MQNVTKNNIRWVKDGDDASQEVLNRQVRDILNNLGIVQNSNIEQALIKNINSPEYTVQNNKIVSQDALTQEINSLLKRLDFLNEELKKYTDYGKINDTITNDQKTQNNSENDNYFLIGGDVVQVSGSSQTDVMSQQQIQNLVNNTYNSVKTIISGNALTVNSQGKIDLNVKSPVKINTNKTIDQTDTKISQSNSIDVVDTTIQDRKQLNLKYNTEHFDVVSNQLRLKKNLPWNQFDLPNISSKIGLGISGESWVNVGSDYASGTNNTGSQIAFYVNGKSSTSIRVRQGYNNSNQSYQLDITQQWREKNNGIFFIVPKSDKWIINGYYEIFQLKV